MSRWMNYFFHWQVASMPRLGNTLNDLLEPLERAALAADLGVLRPPELQAQARCALLAVEAARFGHRAEETMRDQPPC
eukprot:3556863-Lingulodinium_polyedra.AAC.1